jgi:hypothetical protein
MSLNNSLSAQKTLFFSIGYTVILKCTDAIKKMVLFPGCGKGFSHRQVCAKLTNEVPSE